MILRMIFLRAARRFIQILRGNISCTLLKVTKFYLELDTTQSTKVINALLFGFSSFNWLCRSISPRFEVFPVRGRHARSKQSETFRAKIIGSLELQVSLWLADLVGISWGDKSGRHSKNHGSLAGGISSGFAACGGSTAKSHSTSHNTASCAG